MNDKIKEAAKPFLRHEASMGIISYNIKISSGQVIALTIADMSLIARNLEMLTKSHKDYGIEITKT